MYIVVYQGKIPWVSATSFLSELAPGHFLEDLRSIWRGKRGEKRTWCLKNRRRGCSPLLSEGPSLVRPSSPCISAPSLPGGRVGGRTREGGKKMCHLIFAPCPRLTPLIDCRMEGSALRRPSFARASWPDVFTIRERYLASLTVSWAVGILIARQGGQAPGQWHLIFQGQKFSKSCWVPEPAFGMCYFFLSE